MIEPDEVLAIASLLDEAEQLAAAANAKLGEALAIAERNAAFAAFNADRQWFESRPDRSYRARLATQQEVADLHASGGWPEGWTLDPACFVWAIVRGSRTGSKPSSCRCRSGEPREDELKRMWGNAQISTLILHGGRGSEREPGGADRRGKEIVR